MRWRNIDPLFFIFPGQGYLLRHDCLQAQVRPEVIAFLPIWQGLYLPGIVREGVGRIVVAVDCSGSVGARQLSLFEAEIQSIFAGQRPERVHVLYFDACVHKVDTFEGGQQIRLAPVGGGGTTFSRVSTGSILTDLYGSFPEKAPPYPVLWDSTGSQRAPFGQVVAMQSA